ncbi:ATP-binding protein [Goodfellowiella coeruleoviolacea]|nr:tetratricopeptide repeat protein [Goodfellowiella coeruleoviolacea]
MSGSAHTVVQAGKIERLTVISAEALLDIPQQLGPDIAYFTDRTEDLRRARNLLTDREAHGVRLITVSGSPGVGKSAFATRLGNEVREHFPDGVLYLDLHGFDPVRDPLEPEAAIDELLGRLGVPDGLVSGSFETRAARFRSIMDSRETLVILDNAKNVKQVRPLLPAGRGCATVVTSRHRLTGLAGARAVNLDTLPLPDAKQMLTTLFDHGGVRLTDAQVTELAELCACLPLALEIAAQLINGRPRRAAQVIRELGDNKKRLAKLSGLDDELKAIRHVFSCSYQLLPASARQAFRLLGLHFGPRISLSAAEAVTGQPDDELADTLDQLVNANLVADEDEERIRCHDLLRLYARERAEQEESEAEREAAVRRLVTWYLHSAVAAERAINPHRRRVPLDLPPASSPTEAFADRQQALSWCAEEQANLVAAVVEAHERGWHDLAWKLAATLSEYFYQRKPWRDWVATHERALDSAQRCGEVRGQAEIRGSLAIAYRELRRPAAALAEFSTAIEQFQQAGDSHGEAWTRNTLGYAWREAGEPARGRDECVRAVGLFREIDDRYGEGAALNNLSGIRCVLGELGQALADAQQAVRAFAEVGDERSEAWARNGVGAVYQSLGRLPEAAAALAEVAEDRGRIGDHYGQAHTLTSLGGVLRDLGETARARQVWQQALIIFDALADPRAASVREDLATLSAD